MKRMIIAALLAPAVALTAACASLSPQDYNASEARSVETVQYGSVVSVRPVRINADHAPIGTIAGAAVGGLLGSTVGHGSGSAAAAVLGAVGGGLARHAIEGNASAQDGEGIGV